MAAADPLAVEILQAGLLTGPEQERGRRPLAPDRTWLIAAEDGAVELHRDGDRVSLVPPAIALLGPAAGWTLQAAPGARFLHVAFTLFDRDGRPAATATATGGLRLAGVDLPVLLPEILRREAVTLMRLIRNDYWRHPGTALRAAGRLSLLLGALLGAEIEAGVPAAERPSVKGCGRLVGQALRLLDEHRYALSVRELAGLLGVSPDHLGREARRDLGTTLAAYRDRRRRELVLRLLADTTLTISTIAGITGHGRVGALSRSVRRWFGCSPTELRRRIVGTRCGFGPAAP